MRNFTEFNSMNIDHFLLWHHRHGSVDSLIVGDVPLDLVLDVWVVGEVGADLGRVLQLVLAHLVQQQARADHLRSRQHEQPSAWGLFMYEFR